MSEKSIDCEILVIGSGPGGSITACMLAEAGWDVVLVEEGQHHSLDSAESYSLEEMNQKYRNGGLTPIFGKTKMSYVEGCCVGGASEINAGLYHRPLPEVLDEWKRNFEIEGLEENDLKPIYEILEKDFSVSSSPEGVGPASMKIKEGAEKLSWKASEIPRYWKYDKSDEAPSKGKRQSMTETQIPRAISAGCRLLPNTRICKLSLKGKTAQYAEGVSLSGDKPGKIIQIRFRHVFVCGGAIQTPLLLRRSGITHNIGNSLRIHPMVRIPAIFDEPIIEKGRGVPIHQVEEFKPDLTLGCSLSTPAYLALWLGGRVDDLDHLLKDWDRIGVFYASISAEGKGTIRNIPLFNEPLVRLSLTSRDMISLGTGLYKLGQLLFEVGAKQIYPPVRNEGPISQLKGLEKFRNGLPAGNTDVTTIHLFSSCPIGEDLKASAADSFGKLHGYVNIYVNDASMLPGPPGVNPQGTIMALAKRNIFEFIRKNVSVPI